MQGGNKLWEVQIVFSLIRLRGVTQGNMYLITCSGSKKCLGVAACKFGTILLCTQYIFRHHILDML